MKKNFLFLSVLVWVLLFFLSGCGNSPQPGMEQGRRAGREQGGQQTVTVRTQTMQWEDYPEYICSSGTLEGITDVTVTSETSGKIVRLHKQLGDWVDAGETIGHVDNEEQEIRVAQAEAEALSAEAAYEAAQMQLASAQQLFESNNISEAELQNQKSTTKKALATWNSAQANWELQKKKLADSQLTAPVAGYLAYFPIKKGETLSTGKTIATIVNSQQLLLKTGVGAQDIPYVFPDQKVIVCAGDFTVPATIRGVGIKPTEGSSLYPVEIVLDNPENGLFPGMVVQARIQIHLHEHVLVTSIQNFKREFDDWVGFVVKEDQTVERRVITVQQQLEEFGIIQDGLDEGDELVIEGVELLRDGMNVRVRNIEPTNSGKE